MTIQTGNTLPDIELKTMGEQGPESVTTQALFSGKKAVLFAVPGAFTPTCSAAHLPGFVTLADKIMEKGVDLIACVSVNDAFVMDAWGKSANAEYLTMLADGNGELAEALGLTMDASKFGMGTRSKRFAMIIDDMTVTHLAVDEKGLDQTSAESILALL